MKNAPIRHRAEYALYRLVEASILLLPHLTVRRLGRRLGRFGFATLRGPRKAALDNLQRIWPDRPFDERLAITRACFEHFGAHFLELLSFSRFAADQVEGLFEITGWHWMEELEGENRPYLLTAGHYGNWELAMYPLSLRLPHLAAVARPPDNPWVAARIKSQRGRFGAEMIDKAGASFRMLGALRRGARVAIVIDQHVRPSAGIRVPFLGHPAWTSPVLAMLSLQTGAPVVPFRCVPRPGGYSLEVNPPIEPEGAGDEAVAALTRRYLEPLERDIAERPELWLWMHRRWRQ